MAKRVLLIFVAVLMVACSAKIEPYYVEYEMEMRNSSGVDVKLAVENNSSLSDVMVLRDGENVRWRTNSGLYTWPFDNVDTIAVNVYYEDIYLVQYGSKPEMTSVRNPGDRANYIQKKVSESVYSFVYTFTKEDYEKAKEVK